MPNPDAPAPPIAALLYADGEFPESLFREIVRNLRAGGLRLAGAMQHDRARSDRRRCDMVIEDIASGTQTALSEDRGPQARGCRIDMAGLHDAVARVEAMLTDGGVDLLVINKFGKIESEGHGFRTVIGVALERGIPVLIGVPLRNLDAWNVFSGEYACSLTPPYSELPDWLAASLGHARAGVAGDAAPPDTAPEAAGTPAGERLSSPARPRRMWSCIATPT
jgi:nucleoside-triphosphatase THEP1